MKNFPRVEDADCGSFVAVIAGAMGIRGVKVKNRMLQLRKGERKVSCSYVTRWHRDAVIGLNRKGLLFI